MVVLSYREEEEEVQAAVVAIVEDEEGEDEEALMVVEEQEEVGGRNYIYEAVSKVKKHFRKRAGIEPVIGHLKTDHRLSRNFYKGVFGDNINVMLAAAGFNFKRMMNKWKASFLTFLQQLFYLLSTCYEVTINKSKLKIITKWDF